MRDPTFVNKEGNLVLLLPAVYSILEGIPTTPLGITPSKKDPKCTTTINPSNTRPNSILHHLENIHKNLSRKGERLVSEVRQKDRPSDPRNDNHCCIWKGNCYKEDDPLQMWSACWWSLCHYFFNSQRTLWLCICSSMASCSIWTLGITITSKTQILHYRNKFGVLNLVFTNHIFQISVLNFSTLLLMYYVRVRNNVLLTTHNPTTTVSNYE